MFLNIMRVCVWVAVTHVQLLKDQTWFPEVFAAHTHQHCASRGSLW